MIIIIIYFQISNIKLLQTQISLVTWSNWTIDKTSNEQLSIRIFTLSAPQCTGHCGRSARSRSWWGGRRTAWSPSLCNPWGRDESGHGMAGTSLFERTGKQNWSFCVFGSSLQRNHSSGYSALCSHPTHSCPFGNMITDLQIYRRFRIYRIHRRFRIYRIYKRYKICRIYRVYRICNTYLLLTLTCRYTGYAIHTWYTGDTIHTGYTEYTGYTRYAGYRGYTTNTCY